MPVTRGYKTPQFQPEMGKIVEKNSLNTNNSFGAIIYCLTGVKYPMNPLFNLNLHATR